MAIEGVNVIGYSTSKQSSESLQAFEPGKNQQLPEKFHVATDEEVDHALKKAREAFLEYRNYSGKQKAEFLEAIADGIEDLGDELISRASAESGLTSGRLEGERGRTCGQLRMFANLLREGSWVDARINTEGPDVRRMMFPIGPVAVFGASNFPLAFSTAGGDTASALAAGCPVVVKGHESHPGTNELVARAIVEAAENTGMPDGVFSSLNGGPEVGGAIVRHPLTKAVGFTGSFGGGKAIFDLANQREEPIPVYAEMGSVNPVFLLDQKLSSEADELAEMYAGSVTLGVGQFCTNPGLIIGVDGEGLNHFSRALSNQLKKIEPECMLNPRIAETYRKKRAAVLEQTGIEVLTGPAEEINNHGAAAVATISADDFLSNELLSQEVFGPFTLIISCSDRQQMHQVAEHLEGQLTVTLMGSDQELQENKELVDTCREKAGRVIFNGVPTGVAVNHAMHHGGPFPATTDAKYTSVGTTAIYRFVRPIAFQDSPAGLLPDELKADNPLEIWRMVNGELTKN